MRILTTLCITLLLTSMVNAKIVFRSSRDGNPEIYVMDDDGSNPQRLTNNPLADLRPRWSPDGKQIAFMRQVDIRDNQRFHLFIMNADGTNERQLTEPHPFGADTNPVFSPDGKSILFYRYRDNKDHGLYVMDLESGVAKRISDRLMNDAEFTPDGRNITFSNVTVAQNADDANVFIMRADGKDVRPLLPLIPDGIHRTRRFASFSPNGKQILYAESTFENELKQLDNGGWAFFPIAYRTFICDSNGNNPQKLNIPTNWLKYSLVWMDNGKAALFSADKDFDIQQAWEDPERTFDIYRYDIAKRQITPLTTHPASDQAAHWISDDVLSVSPVGKQPVQWGKLKAFLPVYRVVFKTFSRNMSIFLQGTKSLYNVFGGDAYTLNESIRGETNTIKAVAWRYDDEANIHRTTASYDVTVYTPITDEGTRSGVSGKSILYRQYYDGMYITIDCSIYASNGSDIDRKTHGKFRHTIKGKPPVERFQQEEVLLKDGHIYGPKSDSLPIFVGEIREGDTYDSNAYVWLVVEGIAEDWFVENDETFDFRNNP